MSNRPIVSPGINPATGMRYSPGDDPMTTADGAAGRTPQTEAGRSLVREWRFVVHASDPSALILAVEREAAAAAQVQADEAVGLLKRLVEIAEPEWTEGIVDNARRRGGWDAIKEARAFLARHDGEPG